MSGENDDDENLGTESEDCEVQQGAAEPSGLCFRNHQHLVLDPSTIQSCWYYYSYILHTSVPDVLLLISS